jgi:hypothetical protein
MIHSVLRDIVHAMHDYQQRNNIVGECATNVQYLADTLRHNFDTTVEAKPVYMTTLTEDGELKIWTGHVVLFVEGVGIIDPSYETSHYTNSNYFASLTHLIQMYPSVKQDTGFCRKSLEKYLEFEKLAQLINKPDSLIVMNKQYYDAQHEYVEQQMTTTAH